MQKEIRGGKGKYKGKQGERQEFHRRERHMANPRDENRRSKARRKTKKEKDHEKDPVFKRRFLFTPHLDFGNLLFRFFRQFCVARVLFFQLFSSFFFQLAPFHLFLKRGSLLF